MGGRQDTPDIKIFLPFYIPQLVKSLPFYIPKAWKRYPFRAEPPRIVYYREKPPGGCGKLIHYISVLFWLSDNFGFGVTTLNWKTLWEQMKLYLTSLKFMKLGTWSPRLQMCLKNLVIWISYLVFFSATWVSISFSIQMSTLFKVFHPWTHCKYISHLNCLQDRTRNRNISTFNLTQTSLIKIN